MYTPSTIQLYIQFVAVENMRSASVENITLSVYILHHELLRRLVGCLSILCKLSKCSSDYFASVGMFAPNISILGLITVQLAGQRYSFYWE